MDDTATRAATARELWRSVPFECFLAAAAVFLAAGLKLVGVMP